MQKGSQGKVIRSEGIGDGGRQTVLDQKLLNGESIMSDGFQTDQWGEGRSLKQESLPKPHIGLSQGLFIVCRSWDEREMRWLVFERSSVLKLLCLVSTRINMRGKKNEKV